MKRNFRTFTLTAIAVSLALFGMTSCKKDPEQTTPAKTYTIQGLWTGTITNSTSSQFYALSIKPDGKITFEGFTSNQEQFGAGTWTLNGSTFSADVTTLYGFSTNVGVKQTLTATFNSETGVLSSGTFRNTSPNNDSGTFSVTKVN